VTGVLPGGAQIPPEPRLMARFGVSRFTIRQALAALQRRGLVRAEQGRGTFVRSETLHYRISQRTRFSRNLIEQGFDPATEALFEEAVSAPPDVAERLRIPPWQSVLHRRGIGKANGMPIGLSDTYLPLDRFPFFPRVRAAHDTWTAALAAYGVKDYVRAATAIGARMPTAEEAALLRQPEVIPVLVQTSVDADLEGVPIVYSHTVWSAERVVFDIDVGAPETA
jgi:GntR family phosphonate transport system transcriptional regulator